MKKEAKIMTEQNEIYEMKLHETLTINTTCGSWHVIRTPGGWVYNYAVVGNLTSTFVPFDNEFQENKYGNNN